MPNTRTPVAVKLEWIAKWCDKVSADHGLYGPDHPFFNVEYMVYEDAEGTMDRKWEVTVFLPPHGGAHMNTRTLAHKGKNLNKVLSKIRQDCEDYQPITRLVDAEV